MVGGKFFKANRMKFTKMKKKRTVMKQFSLVRDITWAVSDDLG